MTNGATEATPLRPQQVDNNHHLVEIQPDVMLFRRETGSSRCYNISRIVAWASFLVAGGIGCIGIPIIEFTQGADDDDAQADTSSASHMPVAMLTLGVVLSLAVGSLALVFRTQCRPRQEEVPRDGPVLV